VAIARFREVWGGLGTRGQITLVGSGLVVLIVAFFLFQIASRPSFAPLASGLDPTETNDAGQALEAAGIKYRIKSGGTAIEVQSGQESDARVALAEKGVLNGGHVGFEIFDEKSLGATDFQQKVDYQRALEGEIARTIEQIGGVSSAQVQLVLPEESLFTEDAPKPTAAVLLRGGSDLDGDTIKGIAHLTASSVKSLDPQEVTITDESGALVWPRGDGGVSDGTIAKLEAQQRYASTLTGQINALLASTVGPGKATARVHADLNVDQTTIDRVTYADDGTPLESRTDTETYDGGNGAGTTVPSGVSGNATPTYAAGGGANGNSNYERSNETTSFGVDKTVEHTQVAPGAINTLDVALMVDPSVPDDQAAALQQSVAGLAGIDEKRGDTISLSRIGFAEPAEAEAPGGGGSVLSDPMGIAKPALLGLGAIGFLFMMRRRLRKRDGEASVPEPTWVREIEHSVSLGALEAPSQGALPPSRTSTLRDEVGELARKQPQALATQVTQWMKE
jgi:flagellar M-ring protein FliF